MVKKKKGGRKPTTQKPRNDKEAITARAPHTIVRDQRGDIVSISGPDEEGFGLLMQYYADWQAPQILDSSVYSIY